MDITCEATKKLVKITGQDGFKIIDEFNDFCYLLCNCFWSERTTKSYLKKLDSIDSNSRVILLSSWRQVDRQSADVKLHRSIQTIATVLKNIISILDYIGMEHPGLPEYFDSIELIEEMLIEF